MNIAQMIALLSVSNDLITAGTATWAAIRQALIAVGATPEQFDAAEATLTEISARRRRDSLPLP